MSTSDISAVYRNVNRQHYILASELCDDHTFLFFGQLKDGVNNPGAVLGCQLVVKLLSVQLSGRRQRSFLFLLDLEHSGCCAAPVSIHGRWHHMFLGSVSTRLHCLFLSLSSLLFNMNHSHLRFLHACRCSCRRLPSL